MNEGKKKPRKQNLNRFGRFMEALNVILGTSQVDMAVRISMAKMSLSYQSRDPDGPSKDIVMKLEAAYFALAKQKGVGLPVAWDVFFRETLIEAPASEGALQMLTHLESWAAIIKQNAQLRKEVASLHQSFTQSNKRELMRDNRRLREEVHKLREEVMLNKVEDEN